MIISSLEFELGTRDHGNERGSGREEYARKMSKAMKYNPGRFRSEAMGMNKKKSP